MEKIGNIPKIKNLGLPDDAEARLTSSSSSRFLSSG
jgi:hypothetical protein